VYYISKSSEHVHRGINVEAEVEVEEEDRPMVHTVACDRWHPAGHHRRDVHQSVKKNLEPLEAAATPSTSDATR
jgi:hypothetical protein